MAPILIEHLPSLTSPLGLASVAASGFLLLYLVERFVLSIPCPPEVTLIREPKGARRFSLRTRLAYYIDCEALWREAYQNYVKKGIPVVVPGMGMRNELIMPQSSMKWVLAQPDEVLNHGDAFADIDQARYSLGHEKFVTDAWQGLVVKTELNRVLESTCATMNEELQEAFDDTFGTDTENWKEIDLSNTIQTIVARAATRFTVGSALCHNEEFLNASIKVNQQLIMNAGIIGSLPKIIRPIVGRICEFRTSLVINKIKAHFIPIWKGRLARYPPKDTKHDPSSDEEPCDYLQIMLRHAQRERPEEVHDDDSMTRRFVAANFGSMHQTQIQVTNLLLNVLGSDAEFNTISVLRDEVDRILGSDPNAQWTKPLVNKLTRADSVARETLRLHSFGGRSTFRIVKTSDCTTPEGYYLPKGTFLSFLSQPAHCDTDKVDDADRFDPFRFSRARELADSRNEKIPPVSFVTTGPEFLPFGHGKHACPGRFLIDFELKMIMAYVLRNYDIAFPERYEGQRPPNVWMAEAILPPEGVKVIVKRRSA